MNKKSKYISDIEDLNEFVPIPAGKKRDTKKPTINSIYEKNLKALGEHHPELVDIIDSLSIDENRMKIFDSESGNPRVVYEKDDGEKINIHSADDPVACANGAIELLGKIEKEGIVVLFGFGFGYFAEEIFKRFEKSHLLLVYEATPEIFKFAMQIKDFSDLFSSERVKIILGKDADNFSVIHSHHHLIVNGKFWIVEHKPSVKLNSNAYEVFLKRLNQEKSLSDIGVATHIRRGKEFMDACFSNVHSIIRKPGVNGLQNIFKGCTSIVVSAGPSLDKNIHLLKSVKGKAVIIATGGALPTLLTSNIIPDLVVEIDPVSDNIEDKFQGIPELNKVPFICLCQYTPELLNIYPGSLFINSVNGNIAYQWLKSGWEDKGTIECFGGSVAHLAFATAEYIGADVIAFVGQDLSYTGNRLHTVGYSDNWDRSMEAAAEKKQENILGGVPVRDIFDEEVLAIHQFLTFRTAFENRIKLSEKVVINSTEAGLPIEGTKNMRLVDFVDEYCNEQKSIDTFSVLSGLSGDEIEYDIDGLLIEVSKISKKFRSIKLASEKILKYIKKVRTLKGRENKDSPKLGDTLSKINQLITKVRHPYLHILVGYNYGLELYLIKQEIQDIDEIDDKWEMLDKQLERGNVYYNEIVGTISLFNKQLNKVIAALKREKKIDSLLNDISVNEKERFYRAGMMYKDAGIAGQAVKYLEAAISDQQSAVSTRHPLPLDDIYVSLSELYIKQFRYYEAQSILERVNKESASTGNGKSNRNEKVCELMRTCEEGITSWQDRKTTMSKLLAEAESNYGSHLESGYFYFRIKDFERAEKAYLKAIASHELSGKSQDISAACYGLSHTYLEMNETDKAVDALEKALAVDPSNPILYRDLGLIALESDNIEPAELFLSKAIELAPQEAELYKPLANLYVSLGETEKAVALYESALQANADTPLIQQHLAAIYKETISGTPDCQSN